MAIITLTTDFGSDDYYVAAMKGVIYQILPSATVVDITHQIPPQQVLPAAFVLREVWRTFPQGTIHAVVVDPGVGSHRAILAGRYAGQVLLVPDNGLLTFVHQTAHPEQINLVSNTSLFCHPVSATFHGRDIFAPVAAHLAKGLSLDAVGPRTATIALLDLPQVRETPDGKLVGQVVYVDHFGNLVTNISQEQLTEHAGLGRKLEVFIGDQSVGTLLRYYSQIAPGQGCALIGSSGFMEIAVNQGRADRVFRAGIGAAVEVG